jgi:5-methylcytosine-specific restriction endonuclease McrA
MTSSIRVVIARYLKLKRKRYDLLLNHYEPRGARPELVHEYSNLMYTCDQCNTQKGDRYPPPPARLNGHRFFRPDQDIFQE